MSPELRLEGFHVDIDSGTCMGSILFTSPTRVDLFLRELFKKMPDMTVLEPHNGRTLQWVSSNSPEYRYCDIDQVWLDSNMKPFTFKDRYHNYKGMCAKVYVLEANSSQAIFNGEVVSIDELKKKKIENAAIIRELTDLNNKIESSIKQGMEP